MKRSAVQKRFGPYRFLPAFFALGGLLELFMIKVRIGKETFCKNFNCLLYTSPSPRDKRQSRMPSSA